MLSIEQAIAPRGRQSYERQTLPIVHHAPAVP